MRFTVRRIAVGATVVGLVIVGGWLASQHLPTTLPSHGSILDLPGDARTSELVQAIKELATRIEDQAAQQAALVDELNDLKATRRPNPEQQVRELLGDDGYDRYLYASGRPNRLVVDRVFANSAAAKAGLRSGDTVIALGGERVYGPNDLARIANNGEPDELIPVRVLRDGNLVEYYVPRGPLGVSTRRSFDNPDNNSGQTVKRSRRAVPGPYSSIS
jgi:predicted metalloprotease with PDZ domain